MSNLSKKQKQSLWEIIITVILFAAVFACDKAGLFEDFPEWARLGFYVIPYLVTGHSVLKKAVTNILNGNAFDESFLMTVATIAAFAIGEFPEATAVMLFYQIGELFQSYAVGRSRASIAEMMSIAPEYANLETEAGTVETDPEDVNVGDIILIKAGERIPLDGVVIEGETFIDTAALTGESVSRLAYSGAMLIISAMDALERPTA